MNQVFLVIGATLCYVGGFCVMIFLLGVLTELCIEIWDGKFKQICLRFQINPADVAYLAENRKEIETCLDKQRVQWPKTDTAPSGWWGCPKCDALNQYVKDDESVAYCRCCGQAVNMFLFQEWYK